MNVSSLLGQEEHTFSEFRFSNNLEEQSSTEKQVSTEGHFPTEEQIQQYREPFRKKRQKINDEETAEFFRKKFNNPRIDEAFIQQTSPLHQRNKTFSLKKGGVKLDENKTEAYVKLGELFSKQIKETPDFYREKVFNTSKRKEITLKFHNADQVFTFSKKNKMNKKT